MTRICSLQHEFVDYIPDTLYDGVLYVSVPFATVVHRCCCGCGNEVVTPLDPSDWEMTFDGRSVSLSPSIGNWGLACQSHYWISRNQVRWFPRFSRLDVKTNRTLNSFRKAGHPSRALVSLWQFLSRPFSRINGS